MTILLWLYWAKHKKFILNASITPLSKNKKEAGNAESTNQHLDVGSKGHVGRLIQGRF